MAACHFDDAWYKCRTGRDDVVYKNDNSVGVGGGGGGTFDFFFFLKCLF